MGARASRVIVVGAGSAGCVLAARLSADPGLSVTLLEAGPDARPSTTPDEIRGSSFVRAMALPDRHWADLVTTRARGQEPRLYVRGRGVGGSSAINAMVALPGEPADYDGWERDHGCTAWGWGDVAPWFERTALELHCAAPREWGPINLALADVWPECAGGVLLTRSTGGERMSVSDCYLEPIRDRPNLAVRAGAHVARVCFENRRSTGVQLVEGEEIEADLVIISAGAIHSPAILLRSGVDTAGVGDNLRDHPSFPVALALTVPVDTTTLPVATVARMPRWHGGRGGRGLRGEHDLQVLPMEYADPTQPNLGILMGAVMHAHSRGTVRLADDDHTAGGLVVDFDMLSDERDVAALHVVIDHLERAVAHHAFRAVASPMAFDRSDAGLRAAIGDYVHAAGTCAMGTVVDTACRLIGYDRVMVCDASVMPTLPRANTHLPTVMIAERIAAATIARLREQP